METIDNSSDRIDEVGRIVVDSCIKVHRQLGPGLLESTYQACLAHELRNRGCQVRVQIPLPVVYEGLEIEGAYRVDMLIDDLLIIENKSVESLLSIHHAQLLTYLRLSDRRLGYLINWNVPLIKNGIRRIANNL